MLDDLYLRIKPEDIDARVIPVAGSVLEAVEDNIVVLRQGPLYSTRLPGHARAIRSK